MNLYAAENKPILDRLAEAFPLLYINRLNELIIFPARNTYFRLEDVNSEKDIQAKVLEWLSREACKSISATSRKYHLNGINRFLGADFSQEEMYEIYTYLGNACNHTKTLRFIDSGYDLTVLAKNEEPV